MILPERTVDAWACIVLAKLAPGAVVWAPTTNAQANDEPWDLITGVKWKALAFEHKGISDSGDISIPLDQLVRLVRLQMALNSIGVTKSVFYGIPSFGRSKAKPSDWQHRFGDMQFVIEPKRLLLCLPRLKARYYPVRRSSSSPKLAIFPSKDASVSNGFHSTLSQAISKVLACEIGWPLPPKSEDFPRRILLPENFKGVDDEVIKELLRQAEIPSEWIDDLANGDVSGDRSKPPSIVAVPLQEEAT